MQYSLIPTQIPVTEALFGLPVQLLASGVFGFEDAVNTYYSDSVSAFSLYLVLAALSLVICFAFSLPHFHKYRNKTLHLSSILLMYFLGYQLLHYGFDKIFLGQFYTPTQYVLQTPFGNLDRDLLYWSTMGLSPAYQLFLGASEGVAALLILWNRTRVLGLIIAIGILANVVAINFAFDISVKMFSAFLLCTALILSWPALSVLIKLLLYRGEELIKIPSLRMSIETKYRRIVHLGIVAFICFDAIYPFTGNNNTSEMQKVETQKTQNDSIPALRQDFHFFIESVK